MARRSDRLQCLVNALVRDVFLPADVDKALPVQVDSLARQFLADEFREGVPQWRADTAVQVVIIGMREAQFIERVQDASRDALVRIGQRTIEIEVDVRAHARSIRCPPALRN